MSEQRSHWILGIVYINRDDARLFVPLRSHLGLAVNFGNPRAINIIFWIWIAAFFALLAFPIAAHPDYFLKNPATLFWVFASIAGALGLIRVNGCFFWSDYRSLALASFGFLAAGIGFGFQQLVNAPLVLWWGRDQITWTHHLVLAPVASIAQTLGRILAILLLQKARPSSTTRDNVRQGLLIGLGFAITEMAMLYFPVAWAQAPLTYPIVSIWERMSAAMFLIFSTGLLALALCRKRLALIGLVLAIHAAMDFLAGAGESLRLSIYSLEIAFSVCAVSMWAAFLLAARIICPSTKEDSPDARRYSR